MLLKLQACSSLTRKIVKISVLVCLAYHVVYVHWGRSLETERPKKPPGPTTVNSVALNTYSQLSARAAPGCTRSSTLVTAYFDIGIGSKHSRDSFTVWHKRFFGLSDSMVVFTDSHSVQAIRNSRSKSGKSACTIYVVEELTATHTANLTDWHAQAQLDKERAIHKSPLLYIIWNQKSEWLWQTAESNPFSSKYFFWADSGQFRDDIFYNQLAASDNYWLGTPSFIPEHKLALLIIQGFTQCELMVHNQRRLVILDALDTRVGGGNFGGTLSAVRRWRYAYYDRLDVYIKSGFFSGKDQAIMGSICLEQESLCYMIDGSKVTGIADVWFAMQPVLHGSVNAPLYSPRGDSEEYNISCELALNHLPRHSEV